LTAASGIELGNLTANQTITKEVTWEFKGNYHYAVPGYVINHDIEHNVENFNNLEVVAWLQNIVTKKVYNSCTATKENSNTYTVEYEVIGGNGSLLASVNYNPINSGAQVDVGKTVDFTATPNSNYIVKEWKLNGVTVSGNTTINYYAYIDQPTFVTVEFMANPFVVNFEVIGGNGSISANVNDNPINSGEMVNMGDTVNFTVSPNPNYIVKEWKLNNIIVSDNTDEYYSIIVDEDIKVTVEFLLETGIATNNLKEIELFPNPVTNELYICNAQQIEKITITNTMGQILIEEKGIGNNTIVISTRNFPSGLLFVILRNNEGLIITKKVIKKLF
jgi:hypothetical protein